MLKQSRSICLASSSPRRQEFLRAVGLTFDIDPPDVEEVPKKGELVHEFVCRMAREKARSVIVNHPNSIILAGDTVVYHHKTIFGKPTDAEDALHMLQSISDTTHEVFSGLAIVDARDQQIEVTLHCTKVKFKKLSDAWIEWYIKNGEPLDKAGAYSIQGLASVFVESIHGSYNNVVGLPIEVVVETLLNKGWADFHL